MSRMLEALKQIEEKSPQTRQGVKPISPEELDRFGLRPSAEPAGDEPTQAAEPVETSESGQAAEPVEPSQPARAYASPEKADQPVGEATESEKAPEVAQAEPERRVGRLLSPPAEEHEEQYQDLAENVLAQLTPVRPAVLLFTSAGDGEGKTGTLASLAAALAGKVTEKILAVDANFRSPALAAHFGIRADKGLVEVLNGRASWRDVVQETGVDRLSVLPGGTFDTHDGSPPADVKLAPVLDSLRAGYRLVLVDAASLAYPEVAPISRLCEGTYLVVELGRTPRYAARQAVELIGQCGGRVLGCVLTNGEEKGTGAYIGAYRDNGKLR